MLELSILNHCLKFKFSQYLAQVFSDKTTMKKSQINPKETKTQQKQLEATNLSYRSQMVEIQNVDQTNHQAQIPKNSQKNLKWTTKEEEKLMIFFFKAIIKEPFLEFGWQLFHQRKMILKIKNDVSKSYGLIIRKMEQLQSVWRQNYLGQDFINFMMIYWKDRKFRNELGQECINKIKCLQEEQSQHMKMCQQMIKRMQQQQDVFSQINNSIIYK